MINYIEICNEYNIKFSEKLNNDDPEFFNRSFSMGDEIILGYYDNLDWKNIAFFHELGHCLTETKFNFEKSLHWHYELDAWVMGINLAHKYEYYIQPITFIEYIIPSLMSYCKCEYDDVLELKKQLKLTKQLINKFYKIN